MTERMTTGMQVITARHASVTIDLAAISRVYYIYSEDCLTLHLVRPSAHSDLPVMVWIQGGGFQFGNGIDTR